MSNDAMPETDAAHLQPCPTCHSMIPFDANPIVRKGNLDYLISQLRDWERSNRLPAGMLHPLLREYINYRVGMERNWARDLDIDLPTSAPVRKPVVPILSAIPSNNFTVLPPPPPPPPKPSPINAVAEFLESRNIAALHIVGSLLLLTGLFVLVRMQWETWGKYLLLITLASLTASLSFGGRRMSDRDYVSGLILSALGALILPLNFVALYLFGFFGPPSMLTADITGLVTSLGCGTVYSITMLRTRHPLFATLFALAGAGVAFYTVRLLFPGLGGISYAIGFLPTAQFYFYTARHLYRKGETRMAQPFAYIGHGLMGAGVALGFLSEPHGENETLKKGVIAALSTAIYADAAIRLRIAWLAYPAALAAVISSQLLIGSDATSGARGMMLMTAALVLDLLGRFQRQRVPEDADTETVQIYSQATTIYHQAAVWIAGITISIFAFAIGGKLLDLNLSNAGNLLPQAFIAAVAAAFVFLHAAIRENPRRVTLYPALLAVFVATASLVAIIAHALPLLTWLIAPGVTGLLFVLIVRCMAILLPRSNPLYHAIADETFRATTVLFTILPWFYLQHSNTAVRNAHLWLALPGFAILSAGTAWGNRKTKFEWDMHLTAFVLGTISLFAGLSAQGLPSYERALWGSFGGSMMALVWIVVALGFKPIRRILTTDTPILAIASFLPLLTYSLYTYDYLWHTIGILLLLTTVWTLTARARAENKPLYGAGLMLLLAAGLFSRPLDTWAIKIGFLPGHLLSGGGFLVLMPILFAIGHLLRRKQKSSGAGTDYAPPVFHTALAAAIFGGLGQFFLALGYMPLAPAGVGTLWLMAFCFALYGTLRQDKRAVNGATVPLVCGYLPYLTHHWIGKEAWMLSPWSAVLTLTLIGGMMLRTGRKLNAPNTMQGGAILLSVAYLHTMVELFPPILHFAWGIALLPLFAAFYFWNRGALREFALTCATIAISAYIVEIAASPGYRSLIGTDAARLYLLGTLIAYTIGLLAHAIYHAQTKWLKVGMAVGTIGGTLWAAGYPYIWMLTSEVGITLAVISGFWYGATLLLSRPRPALAETMTQGAMLIAGIGAAIAFIGAADPQMVWYSIGTLVLTCALFITRAQQLPDSGWKHVAFASGFAAFAVYLHHTVGFKNETADLYFIPLGIYLILLGGRTLYRYGVLGTDDSHSITQKELESAKSLCGTGLLLMLTPTLLATIYDVETWWHPFLLVAECLTAIALGIGFRLRLFLGFGIAFLVALLGVKAYQPGQQKSFAFYLTILGILTLIVAIYFDRSRGNRQKKTTAPDSH